MQKKGDVGKFGVEGFLLFESTRFYKKNLADQTKHNPIRDLKLNKTYANFFGCELLLNEP
jgi:hypothetical protein